MRGLYANIIASSRQTSVVPPIITTNLELHYDFTNPACYGGSGTVVQDLTANNRDLTFVNVPSWQGSYFKFDGVNDYGIVIGYNNAPLIGSVSFWFRPNASYVNTGASMRLLGWNGDWEMPRWGTAPTPCGQTVLAGQMVFDLGTGPTSAGSNRVWLNNTWYNVTVTWNKTAGRSNIYLNGVLDRVGCPPANGSNIGSGMTIGRSQGNVNEYWDADLGWLTVYSAELTSAQVLQNFDATKADYGY